MLKYSVSTTSLILCEASQSEEEDEKKLQFWKNLANKFKFKIYTTKFGIFTLRFDFTKFIAAEEFNIELNKNLDKFEIEEWERRVQEPSVDIDVEIEIHGEHKKSSLQNIGHWVIEMFLYELFLISNLAFPCSFALKESKILGSKDLFGIPINLDSDTIGFSSMDLYNHGLPAYKVISIDKTLEWFDHLNIGVKQVAQTRIEKALFSFLNLCASGRMLPVEVLWLVNCIETLYKTKIGENFSSAFQRISTFLEITETNIGLFKKNLREFYDFRSAFIHGGYSVPHPAHNDLLDDKYDDNTDETNHKISFGLGITICTLQKMIEEGIVELNFIEVGKHVKIEFQIQPLRSNL